MTLTEAELYAIENGVLGDGVWRTDEAGLEGIRAVMANPCVPLSRLKLAALVAEVRELRAANADLVAQRDKLDQQRSEAFTQQDTRLEFCRKELEEARDGCLRLHAVAIAALTAQRDLGVQRETALREALEGVLPMVMYCEATAVCHDEPCVAGRARVEAARAALSGASSPATSTKENE